MKFKLLALAAVMAASGVAGAAQIDNGGTGNGGLFFSAWDASNSYSRNLGLTIDSFEAALAAPGYMTPISWTADATFTNFLATADMANLSWNVVAVDTAGAKRLLETYTVLPTTTRTNDVIKNLSTGTQTFVNSLNFKLAVDDSATYAVGTVGYAGGAGFGNNGGGQLNFSNAGTTANSSYATGLNFMRIDALASGTAKSIYTTEIDTDAVHAAKFMLQGSTLIAAVPEPETYAMLLAGLGLMGAVARRRNKKSV